MDGIIFGWSITGPPVAHHVGIVLQWDGPRSIVTHYGVEARSIVIIETLRRAALRTSRGRGIMVHFNPYFKASIPWDTIDASSVPDMEWNNFDTQIELTPELEEYERTHPRYDMQCSNCQHFVSNFVGDIYLESDLYDHVPKIFGHLANLCFYGSESKIKEYLLKVADTYIDHRNNGICRWDYSMNLWIPPEEEK